MKDIKRGAIIYVDLGIHPKSSVQSGIRPCVVVSNNKNNKCSKVLSVCPCTARRSKKNIPTHIALKKSQVNGRFEKDSVVLVEQVTTVDKRKAISVMGYVSSESGVMDMIDEALRLQFAIGAG